MAALAAVVAVPGAALRLPKALPPVLGHDGPIALLEEQRFGAYLAPSPFVRTPGNISTADVSAWMREVYSDKRFLALRGEEEQATLERYHYAEGRQWPKS